MLHSHRSQSDKASGQITLDNLEGKRYDGLLLGIKTSNGETVNSMFDHFCDKAAERDFSHGEVRDCQTKATSIYPGNTRGRMVYQLGGMKVVFSPGTGEIVTVIKRNQS